jgi:hypothetical protein
MQRHLRNGRWAPPCIRQRRLPFTVGDWQGFPCRVRAVSLGHDVALFATGDSVTTAQLVPVAPRALRLSRPPSDPAIATAALLEAVDDAAPRFDVIHSHLDWVHLPLLRCLRVPFLTTLHGRLDLPNIELMGQRFPNAPFVSISQSQRTT